MNVTVNITNETEATSCVVDVYNTTDLVFHFTDGEFQEIEGTMQCFKQWDFEYWRNSGQWMINMSVTTTNVDYSFTNFTYEQLSAFSLNSTLINFTGNPTETINSTNAYPLGVKSIGNENINVSVKGNNFVGLSNASYFIGMGNVTYNETDSGSFKGLEIAYYKFITDLEPSNIQPVYFKGHFPELPSQIYQGDIDFNGE